MSVKEGLGTVYGIAMRTIEDQSLIVASMRKLTLVHGQSHNMDNQKAATKGLVQSELIRDYQASEQFSIWKLR